MKTVKYIYDSIKSPFHKKNEDKILIIKEKNYNLFFLFDGVGSAINAIDSVEMATNFIKKNYKKYKKNNSFCLSKIMFDTHDFILSSLIKEAFCTYVAIYVPNQEKNKISISSIGDSRIYGISKQYIIKYTEDDSIPNVENAITKCLGMINLKRTDFNQKNFSSKETRYLISSDGFYKLIEKDFKSIKKFHYISNFKRLSFIKKNITNIIVNNNNDDSSYILIDTNV